MLHEAQCSTFLLVFFGMDVGWVHPKLNGGTWAVLGGNRWTSLKASDFGDLHVKHHSPTMFYY